MTLRGMTTTAAAQTSCALLQIRKQHIRKGDIIIITTRHSVYTLRALGNNRFDISGGWFERSSYNGKGIGITGCTWGGSMVYTEAVAACGLCTEFGNRVITSPVVRIAHLPGVIQN
jgi:hypothetical protein